MKEDEGKRRRLISEQLKEKIKKKPYQDTIEGRSYIYGLLRKKNQSFFLTNQRLLLLIANQAIAYARGIPEHVHLPFYDRASLPQFKAQFSLKSIENVTVNANTLVLEFTPDTKTSNWEFICESSSVAQEWKEHILSAVNYLQVSQANTPIAVSLPEKQRTLLNEPPHNNSQVPAFTDPNQPKQQNLVTNSHLNTENVHSFADLHIQPQQQKIPQNHLQQYQKTEAKLDSFEPNPQRQSQPNFNKQPQASTKMQPQKKSNLAVSRTVDVQAEYYLKKKEEQQKKRQLANLSQLQQRPTSVRNSIEVLTQLHWDYEFAKSQNEYLVIQQFKKHVESISTTLIDELGLAQSQRQVQPVEESATCKRYRLGDLALEIFCFELGEVQHFEQSITVIRSEQWGRTQREFKNASYILQMTRNKGRFRVPLMMLLQYKGFMVSAKANVHSTSQYAALAESLEWDVSEFERETRIERTVFEDEDNVRVLAADQSWFQNLNGAQNTFKRFDLCFLTDVRNFLPRDLHTIGRDGSTDKCLRAELLQDEKYDEYLFPGDDVSRSINKMNVPNEKRKAIALLSDIGQSIPHKLKELAEKLGNLEEVFTNSQELAAIMHFHGLNVRYLGQLANYTTVEWLRSLLVTEMAARSAKYFLKYELQQGTLALRGRTVEENFEFQANQVIGWLNRIFGVGPESEGLWSQISRQVTVKFKANIQKEGLSIGYFLQALSHGCGFTLKSQHDARMPKDQFSARPYFKTNNVFFRSDFQNFTVKSKAYDPSFTQHYLALQNKLEVFSFQNYEYVATLLNIHNRDSIDSHYSLSDMGEQLVTFLSNWLSPEKADFLYRFSPATLPSKYFYELQCTAIKWHLKSGSPASIARAEELRDQLIQHINYWLGEFHPLLTQIYDIFSRYYLGCKEERFALSFCRSSLKNQERLLGSNHFKLADAYYALGETQFHYCKRKEALASYMRAYQIIEENGRTQSQAFVEVSNKIAQIYLQNGAVQQALASARKGLALAQQIGFKDGYLEAAELVGRCYQFQQNWEQYASFAGHLASMFDLFCQSPLKLQRISKVVILPALRGVALRSRATAAKLLAILNTFAGRPAEWSDGFEYLKLKVGQRSFPGLMLECLDSAQKVVGELQMSGTAGRWRGLEQVSSKLGRESQLQQFLSELECLKWMLSGHFMEGLLESE